MAPTQAMGVTTTGYLFEKQTKIALTGNEVKRVLNERLIEVDGKVRTDTTCPEGFMGEYLN